MAHDPSFVNLDLTRPGIDGLVVLKPIKSFDALTRVVMNPRNGLCTTSGQKSSFTETIPQKIPNMRVY